MQTIKSWPEDDRPREKLLKHGAQHLTDAELLAIIIRNGSHGRTALDLARDIIQQFGGLRKMFAADLESIKAVRGFGLAKFAEMKAVIELANRHLYEQSKPKVEIQDSQQIKLFLKQRFQDFHQEAFSCIFLNAKHAIIDFEIMFYGNLTQTHIDTREIIKRSLFHNACSIILCHNHPSGDPTPSAADIEITQMIKEALKMIDVDLLDHIIVGENDTYSLAEHQEC